MGEENFYTILGVNEKSTAEEIKKAYREKSKLHHPDAGGSEDSFKKINEAYSTLSDPQKKNQYDNRHNQHFGNFGGGFGSNMSDIFEQMFNFGRSQKNKTPYQDKIVELEVTPVESFLGSSKTITYTKNNPCNVCSGKGGDKVTCPDCKGQGFFAQTINNGMFNQIFRSVCNRCSGDGFVFRNKCMVCNGSGVKSVTDNVTITIPHGIDDGQFLKVQGKGDYINNGFGNLLLKIKMKNADNFEKINNDLIYSKYFTLEDLQKEDFEVPHPDGEINIKFPETFDTSTPLRVRGKGYRNQTNGDLYIKMNVKYKR